METTSDVPLGAALGALAYVGDLSMGQPGNHSARTAVLACAIARTAGMSEPEVTDVYNVALLRWSGCTANAAEFSELLGDDVNGREAMLSLRLGAPGRPVMPPQFFEVLPSLGHIHCDVARQVGASVGLRAAATQALGRLFDPVGDDLPESISVVTLAGDIEIFSRVYGIQAAATLVVQRAGSHYPASLVNAVLPSVAGWLETLDDRNLQEDRPGDERRVSLDVVGDIVDLKMPCMAGHSRQVAEVATRCAGAFALGEDKVVALRRASLLHGIGRATVANAIWQTPGPLPSAAWEQVRLVPYWTAGAGRQVPGLVAEAALASHTYERADGTGYFRGSATPQNQIERAILQVSNAWVALRSPRPWRGAMDRSSAATLLASEASAGRFHRDVVAAVIDVQAPVRHARTGQTGAPLSVREIEILRRIGLGESSKSVARLLSISPSTVRTHVESIFRKLDCSTRAAAALKAMQLGLL